MAKKNTVVLTREQQVEAEYATLRDAFSADPALIATPTRMFEVGQQVRVGNLNNVIVLERRDNDKVYIVEHDRIKDRDYEGPTRRGYLAQWWFNVEALRTPKVAPSFMQPELLGRLTNQQLSSLFFLYGHGGLVCDPRFQRGYVWTKEDKYALIDSVFDRQSLGTVVLVSHSGYLHKDSDAVRQYVTLTGERVDIKACDDYTNSIIDGQQRLTTLLRFWLGLDDWRGHYYQDLCYRDRNDFEDMTQLSVRTVNEDDATFADLLKLFLQVNRGVPQSEEHLARVRALYEKERQK